MGTRHGPSPPPARPRGAFPAHFTQCPSPDAYALWEKCRDPILGANDNRQVSVERSC